MKNAARFLPFLFLPLLVACGGDKQTVTFPENPEGKAVNGVMAGAEVRLYGYEDGDWVDAGVSTTTDDEGRFDLNGIPSTVTDGPVRLVAELDGNGGSMICTSPSGCGQDYGFGDVMENAVLAL